MSKSEQQLPNMEKRDWAGRFITSFVLIIVLLFGGTQSSRATQAGKPQVRNEQPQTVQSVVAKQAS